MSLPKQFHSHNNVTLCLFILAIGATRFFKPIDLYFQFRDDFSISFQTDEDHPNDGWKEAVKHKAQ